MSFNYLDISRKSKRSQSALEYMMTYGWAILIIVIVAVILYSMGIFNPSSSISTTITGFSSTPVSSVIFTDNGGLSLSVQNSVGYPIEITNITATTTTGGKVTIEPNITLLPGKSQVLVLSKVFTASSQNSHISTAVTITYKEISQPLPGPYVSAGSITGSTPAVIYPSNYTFAAVSKLTIKNTQSSATSNPFQQMVNITSADNGWQLISPDFGQNVEFFYANGTVIPSWLESYTSSNAIWWLKLGSIPASSSITVYMGIAPTSTNLFNTVNDGEAPQIPCGSTPTSSCSNYAEYDDGANVFMDYWNFNGTSLPSYATILDSPNVNNGLIFNNSDHQGIAFSISLPSSGAVVESGYSYPDSSALGIDTDYEVGFGYGGFSSSSHFYENGNSVSNFGGSNSGLYVIAYSGGNQAVVAGPIIIGTPKVNVYYKSYFAFGPNGVLQSGWDNSYLSATDTTYSLSQVTQVFVWQSGVGSPHTVTNWFRVRAYPPNGVMPSVSFGGVA